MKSDVVQMKDATGEVVKSVVSIAVVMGRMVVWRLEVGGWCGGRVGRAGDKCFQLVRAPFERRLRLVVQLHSANTTRKATGRRVCNVRALEQVTVLEYRVNALGTGGSYGCCNAAAPADGVCTLRHSGVMRHVARPGFYSLNYCRRTSSPAGQARQQSNGRTMTYLIDYQYTAQ